MQTGIGQTPTAIEDRFITTKEAAAYLSLSVAQLDIWRSQGEGPPFRRFKRHVRYKLSELHTWVESLPRNCGPKTVGPPGSGKAA